MRVMTVVLACVVGGCGQAGVRPENWKNADVVEDAATISHEYANNEIAGESKYKNKLIATMGFVHKVKTNSDGGAVVHIAINFNDFECQFDRRHVSEVSTLMTPDKVIILGYCQGRNDGTVTLTQCRVIKVAKTPEQREAWDNGGWKK